nr:unnamed protein product [Callosobruchus analis]
MGNTSEAEALISIAPYNDQNPSVWFHQIESCFCCKSVTMSLKGNVYLFYLMKN